MHDVVLIGGGPAGSTCASFLRKYGKLDVLVLEREKFPREHVGESGLPPLCRVLDEMGCWDKVEAANFPIKIGATYKWGRSPELWDFEFFPASHFQNEPRPAKYVGQRKWTAFQVDRAIYDQILLDHAESLGAKVRQETAVRKVLRDGDRVAGIELENGEVVKAHYYVDCSGHSGLLRRAMGVETDVATSLQNIAVWDYWQNADWAVEIGVGATRVQVMSLGYGWIWFIPLGPTRTSVGLVIPASYYKDSGKKPGELYAEAIRHEPRISQLMKNATAEGKFQSTKDWSFIAKRLCGENWFLAGESAGFADPILAAGLTLTQAGARDCAITILELLRGGKDASWLLSEYQDRQSERISSHIRFADYWYTSNTQFTDLKAFTAQIAQESGLTLTPDKAWAWLAQGGFIDNDANLGPAGFSIDQVKTLGTFLAEVPTDSVLKTCNVFKLNRQGAFEKPRAHYGQGFVSETRCLVRGSRVLPLVGIFEFVTDVLKEASTTSEIAEVLKRKIAEQNNDQGFINEVIGRVPHAIEAMTSDGWIVATYDPATPLRDLPERVARILKWNEDNPVLKMGVSSSI